MRLINTSTYKLQEFNGNSIPTYSILSHRWENEEMSFHEMTSSVGSSKVGWAKIESACRQAASDDFEWIWIDTCCIDKTSSAELSEAINSMFRWYQESKVCYAYLSDVPPLYGTDWIDYSGFRDSLWFTRGWTLQELLAPHHVVFYDQDWTEIGTKVSLSEQVQAATGIQRIASFEKASVAEKMSWAAKRKTTREEDIAYCLMGIFGVNMPALYGEGQNAFRRLQLQILQQSDDESIFAWTWHLELAGDILAPFPAAFEKSGDIQKVPCDPNRAPYTMTNKGLQMSLFLIPKYAAPGFTANMFLAPLNCSRRDDLRSDKMLYALAIWLKHEGSDQYVRVSYGELIRTLWSSDRAKGFTKHTLYVSELNSSDWSPSRPYSFIIKYPSLDQHGFTMKEQFLMKRMSERVQVPLGESFTLAVRSYSIGGFLFIDDSSEMFAVVVDIWKTRPGVHIRTVVFPKRVLVWPDPITDRSPLEQFHGDFKIITENPPDSDMSLDALMQGDCNPRRMERLSVPLYSGKSASVVLKPSGLPGVDYAVEVTINPGGGLRWPL